ncbi:hypothetical protein Cob_v000049 [Colletotrichum orbiculare MAFF 240422]|uniref:Uncharacterized protein n=1 Tax=Colletotrichum orbiculare (strain 104-T / ATCC 96160 / CBS 514.97 / LARS 414 / MAFF 240422) TaxID=1213857 RepID=A0A484G6T8_COLOR|nr:hypothetical protein Cob_v000049 [Colletotrichum orbiculare MAFF 240422]
MPHGQDVTSSAKTLLPPPETGKRRAAPTPPPNVRFATIDLKRQAAGPTCGYYEYSIQPYECYSNQKCATSGRYFGCTAGSTPYTTCLDGFDSVCAQSRQGPGTLCCNFKTNLPLCVTALKPLPSRSISTITAFRCGNNYANGRKMLLETDGPDITAYSVPDAPPPSSEASSSSPPSTVTVSVPMTTMMAAVPGSASSESPTEVGAIIGGVIGAIAAVGLVIIALFWIWVRSRSSPKEDTPSNGNSIVESGTPNAPQPYWYSAMAPPENNPHISSVPETDSTFVAYPGVFGSDVNPDADLPGPDPYLRFSPTPTPVTEAYYPHPGVAVTISPISASEHPFGAAEYGRERLSDVSAPSPAKTTGNMLGLPSEQNSRK